MPDRENVIKTLEKIKAQTKEIGLDKAVLAHKFMDEIMNLLKEQEPKQVESIQVSRTFFAELTGCCPSCNRSLKELFNKCFCGNCGQAVKWND